MRFTKLVVVPFVLLLALAAGPASADDYYVDITNNTGYTIVAMQVSPSNSEEWGGDVLGTQVVPANGSVQRVFLRGFNNPLFDIRLIDEDGDTYTFWGVNVSTTDLNVTIGDMD